MNFNSKILKISIVIALIFMLIPIVAAEDTADSVYAQDEGIAESNVIQSQDEIADTALTQEDQSELGIEDSPTLQEDSSEDDQLLEEEEDYGDEQPDDVDIYYDEESSADLEITSYVVPQKLKVGDYAIFTFIVTNNGPDTATNVVAFANILQGGVYYISSTCDKGEYDSYTGIWEIGDLEAGDYAMLVVLGKVAIDTPIITIANVTSDTPDPDESNNYYSEYIPVESEGQSQNVAEAETLPATGNPIVMALLAVLAIVGITVGKRN